MLETCPFCGKSFKRLKTHLPHCKHVPVAQATQPSKNPFAAAHLHNQPSPVNTSSPPSLVLTETGKRGKKSIKKTEKPSSPPSSASSSPTKKTKKTPASSSSKTLPSSPTQKNHRLVDDVEPVPLPPLFTITKHRKKSLGAPKEHSDSQTGSKPLSGIPAAPTGLLLSPEPRLAPDLLSHTSPESHGDKGSPTLQPTYKLKKTENTGSTKAALDPGPVRLQPKDAVKKKPQRQKAGLAATTQVSVSQGLNDWGLQGPSCRAAAWPKGEEDERNGGSSGTKVERMERLHRSGDDKIRPLLQDHTILSNLNTESQKLVLDQIKPTTAVQSAEHRFSMIDSRRPVKDLSESCPVVSLLPPMDVPVLPASAPGPLISSRNQPIMSSLPSSLNCSLGLGNTPHKPDTLPSVWNSSVPTHPAAVVMETAQSWRPGMELKTQAQQLPEQEVGGALTQRALGEVRLRQLPGWLADQLPNNPREAAHMFHRGWQWYYRRYINVKKGGIGGVAMLLTGYCVLSYTWNYPHIKRDRWRKYH